MIERMFAEERFSLLDLLPRVRVAQLEVEKWFPGDLVKRIFSNLNSPIDYEAAQLNGNIWN